MLVTIHLAEGQTAKQLIAAFTELAGGVRPRTSSGRFGVLVDSELAYRYLATFYRPADAPAVEPVPEPEPEPEPVAEQAPEPAVVARPPAKKAAAKKAQPKAAVKEGE